MTPTRATPDSSRSHYSHSPHRTDTYPHHPACTSCRPVTLSPSLQAVAGRAGYGFVPLPSFYGMVQGAATAPLRHGLEEEVQAMRGLTLHTFAGDRRFPIYPFMLRQGWSM